MTTLEEALRLRAEYRKKLTRKTMNRFLAAFAQLSEKQKADFHRVVEKDAEEFIEKRGILNIWN